MLALIGVNHKTAPVSLREKLAVSPVQAAQALHRINAVVGINECVIVSTCNRTEAYASLFPSTVDAFVDQFAAIGEVAPDRLKPHLYGQSNHEAARHLFRVASGLDSLIIGETQITGQVRKAYEIAQECGASGKLTNRLFESALAVSKRVRTETQISSGCVSVGAAAVDLAETLLGGLGGKRVLLLGAGKISEMTAARLRSRGATGIIVTSRTHERAKELAKRFGGMVARFDQLAAELSQADMVISSSSAPHHLITREMLESVMLQREMRPLGLIDLAVPRDIDPRVADIGSVALYDIDSLAPLVEEAWKQREKDIQDAESIIEYEVDRFSGWQSSHSALPVIQDLRRRLEDMAEAEMRRYSHKLNEMNPESRQVVEQLLTSLINRISHYPTDALKDIAASGDMDTLRAIASALGLEQPDDSDWAGHGI